MILRRALPLLAVLLATGCSALTPFATAPLAAAPGVKDAGLRVAICYNAFKTPPEKVQEMAQAQCAAKTVATPVGTDYHLDNCPVMTPGRATFICRPK